jgi:hypothetical protein
MNPLRGLDPFGYQNSATIMFPLRGYKIISDRITG